MSKNNFYYTLLLTQTSAIISLVKIENSSPKILKKNHFYFTSLDELKQSLTLSVFKQKETDEIILFLNHSYLDLKTNELKTEYKELFTTLFKNSPLKPIGYIETYEAIVNYFSEQQNFPLNALILEIEKTTLSISLVKGGKIEISQSTSLGSNLKEYIISALNEINNTPFPAKIFTLNFDEENEQVEELIKIKWPKELFLHHPEIKIFSPEKINSYLIKVFAKEISKEEITEKEDKPKEALPFGFSEDESLLEKRKKPELKIPTIALPKNFPKINLSFNLSFSKKFILLPFLLLILFTIVFAHEKFIHKATIKISPKSQNFEVSDTISYNTNSDLFEIKSKTVDVKKTFTTSGEKQVGEKASGKVKLYNFSDTELLITSKTPITYKEKTYFVKESVKVPPAKEETSGDTIIKKPGIQIVEVEANDIGEDYNLSTSEKLKIGNLDTDIYFAKIEEEISGGTSEKVQTLSKQDIEKALEEIKKTAIEKIDPDELIENSKDYIFLKELISAKIKNEKIDKEIGEITDKFSITAQVEINVPFLNKRKLLETYKNQIKSELGEDFTYEASKKDVSVKVNKKEETSQIEINISGKAYKNVNLEKLKEILVFKTLNSLPKFPELEKIEVEKNTSFLPFFSGRLPSNKENIELKLNY